MFKYSSSSTSASFSASSSICISASQSTLTSSVPQYLVRVDVLLTLLSLEQGDLLLEFEDWAQEHVQVGHKCLG